MMINLFYYKLNRKLKVTTRNILEYLNLYSHFPNLRTKFVFVVGCSNSGTTLLTTILGRHPSILALGDESYIFGQDKIYIKTSLKQWDIISRQFKKKVFVEKTPKHIFEIPRILKFVPDAKIIFIIRNPEDTIASQITRGVEFNYALNKYLSANGEGLKYAVLENVHLCRFEDLVKNSRQEVGNICDFMELDFEDEMLTSTKSVYHIWSQTDQNNKKKRSKEVTRTITDTTGKGSKLFTSEQLDTIQRKTAGIIQSLKIVSN